METENTFNEDFVERLTKALNKTASDAEAENICSAINYIEQLSLKNGV